MRRCARSRLQVARVNHELHTAHTILDIQGIVAGLAGIEPRTRNALLMAVQPLAAQVGETPACQALCGSRASFYRLQRSTPGRQLPRPTPARALCEARARADPAMCSPARASKTGRQRRSLRRCSTKAITSARSRRMYRIAGRRSPGPRAAQSDQSIHSTPSPYLVATAQKSDLVLAHRLSVGADQVDVLLPKGS